MASNAKSPNFFSRLVKGSGPKSPDEAQAAHTRRREQVRRAQRTHRERKEKYVRNLEVEVTKLREKDAAHANDVENFKIKIRHLQDLLTSNGIAVPAHLLLSQTPSPQASIVVVNHPDGTQGIHATMPAMQNTDQQYYSSSETQQFSPGTIYQTTTTSSSEPFMYQPAMNSASEPASSVASHFNTLNVNPNSTASASSYSTGAGPTPSTQNKRSSTFHPHGLDAAQVAVDFVLALESPCLHHHPDDPNDTTKADECGHALMLQSPIMNRCPTPLFSHGSQKPRYAGNMSWNVPAQEIEKLLDLSGRLSLEGEITPIEAWQRVKQHPGFVRIDASRLEALKNVLVGEVQCYGFGAVIDEDYFEMILRQAFAQLGP